MKAVIVYKTYTDTVHIHNGIFNGISYEDLIGEIIRQQAPYNAIDKAEAEDNYIYVYFPLTVSGKTYAERKEDLIDKALKWCDGGSLTDWAYSEIAEITGFFETNAKRYGLTREFRENGII